MASSKTFDGITPAVWECIQRQLGSQSGTTFNPPNSTRGTITIQMPGSVVVLSYSYDAPQETLTITIERKPLIVTDDQIWDGIQGTVNQCRGDTSA